MPGRSAAATDAVQRAVRDWRGLVRLSRPRTWLLGAIPFAIAAYDAERAITPLLIAGTLFFTAPFALLRHGSAAIHGPGADPHGTAANVIRTAILATSLPLLAILVLGEGIPIAVALALVVGLALADVAIPLRLRDRPAIDLATAATILVMPAVCGALLGLEDVAAAPWVALVASWAWAVGLVALASIRRWTAVRPDGSDDLDVPTATVGTAGARVVAIAALVADVVAAVLLATLGHLGLLAGLGVALTALLPLMLVTAERGAAAGAADAVSTAGPSDDPAAARTQRAIRAPFAAVAAALETAASDAMRSAAARAWADLGGMLVLIGGWLGILLLQHWSITTYTPTAVGVLVPAAAAGYALANVAAIGIATRRRRVRSARRDGADAEPSVLIVVPTRDAIRSLPSGLAALRAQTYPNATILVVDDGSVDGGADEAAAWLGEDAVLRAPSRPPGWGSRAWARQVGAAVATTDLVLFVDPDTTLSPVATRILVEQLGATGRDLLVGIPRAAMPSAGERASVPGFGLLWGGFAPAWWTAITGRHPRALGPSDGPLVLVRREAWRDVTGMAPSDAVSGAGDTGSADAGSADAGAGEPDPGERAARLHAHLTEAFADAGRRIGVVRVPTLAATRRYRDTAGAMDGWRRWILPIGGGTLAGAIAVVLVELVAFLGPILVPAVALIKGAEPELIAIACVPLLILLAMRLALSIVGRQPLWTIPWHPVTVLIALGGQLAGIVDHVAGRPTGTAATADGRALEPFGDPASAGGS